MAPPMILRAAPILGLLGGLGPLACGDDTGSASGATLSGGSATATTAGSTTSGSATATTAGEVTTDTQGSASESEGTTTAGDPLCDLDNPCGADETCLLGSGCCATDRVCGGNCCGAGDLCSPPGDDGIGPMGEITCVQECELKPELFDFAPEKKYTWEPVDNQSPAGIHMTPVVVQLDDDDCDGKVTGNDIPYGSRRPRTAPRQPPAPHSLTSMATAAPRLSAMMKSTSGSLTARPARSSTRSAAPAAPSARTR